jgi:uroporphyrinogen-III synthase
MVWANLLPPMVLGLLLSSACAALVPFPIVRESQLPLSGKRVLVAAPRAVAAPLAAALIAAGARPLWSQCIITEPLDEESLGQLDDALLRLTEYDLLLLLSRDAVDAVVQRGLLLSDSSEDVLRLMLRASNAEIAALGPAALHLSATLKLAAGAVPVDPTPDGLAAVLSALGTVQAGSRVLVPTYADTYAPEPPYCT